ncbi:hypothetical protein H2204_005653 [Knufia peltigerae]|uniref:Uncharacterized protein n=1 Tax=Knufia peltigerae TaxID=1002370 RepID=A0AA39CZQ1_9EURO|nr:hypothetical protein H2204_005653 [Knufia peltigerae]
MDLKDDHLAETVQSVKGINPEAIVVSKSGDITDNETIDNLIKLTVTKFGRLDYAVNSAGIIGKQKEITQLSLDDYDFVESVNARAIWLCERAQIAQMLTQEPLPTQ